MSDGEQTLFGLTVDEAVACMHDGGLHMTGDRRKALELVHAFVDALLSGSLPAPSGDGRAVLSLELAKFYIEREGLLGNDGGVPAWEEIERAVGPDRTRLLREMFVDGQTYAGIGVTLDVEEPTVRQWVWDTVVLLRLHREGGTG